MSNVQARLLTPFPALLGTALLAAAWGGGLAACSEVVPGEMRYIQEDQRRVENPGKIGARAIGRGCDSTKGDALEMARRVALYNLRSVTGQARYTVTYRITNFIPSAPEAQDYYCYEVEAESVLSR